MSESYVDIEQSGWHARVLESQREALVLALIEGIGTQAVSGGRGSTYTFSVSDGTAYLRRYRRGGMVRIFLKKVYYKDNRALRELELLRELKAKGLAVPEALGACWRSRFGFYEGAIATRALKGENLYDYLRKTNSTPDATLRAAGAVIRMMHEMHVWHADLQVRNIMVCADGVYLIDFDNACRLAGWHTNHGMRNLLRLSRSFSKAGFPDSFFETLCKGYGTQSPSAMLSSIFELKHFLSDLMRGKRDEHG